MSRTLRLLVVALVAALLLAASAVSAYAKVPRSVSISCHDAGFWKSHPDAWPTNSVSVGYDSAQNPIRYTKAQALAILRTPADDDMTYVVFREDLTAKLNAMAVTDPPFLPTGLCLAADMWLQQYPLGSGVSRTSQAWADIEPVVESLSDFNHWHP